MDNNSLRRVFKSKSLGIIIDDVLFWSGHVAHITKKVNKAIKGMKQIRPFVQRSLLKLICTVSVFNLFSELNIQYNCSICSIVHLNLEVTTEQRMTGNIS